MTLLRPTPSRRRWLNRFPLWGVVVAVGLTVLLAAGLLLLVVDDGGSSQATADPCAGVTPAADATTPPGSGGPVNVLNATDRAGLAAQTADELTDRGFTIGVITNAPSGTEVEAAAEVRFGPGSTAWARWVAAHVPGAELVPDSRTTPQIDLVLGEAYERTVGEKKALRAYAESGDTDDGC